MLNRDHFSKQLKVHRKMAGLSLSMLAKQVGVSKSHLWDLEQGRSANPSLSLLRGGSTRLGVSITTLVDPEDQSPLPQREQDLRCLQRDIRELEQSDIKLIVSMVNTLKKSKQRALSGDVT